MCIELFSHVSLFSDWVTISDYASNVIKYGKAQISKIERRELAKWTDTNSVEKVNACLQNLLAIAILCCVRRGR